MGDHSDEQLIRRNAARIAFFGYLMTAFVAIAGIVQLIEGDEKSAILLAASATLVLVSAIISTFRTRGY